MRLKLHFDENEKVLIRIFVKDEKEVCPYYILKTPLAKQYAGFISIYRDLHLCNNAILETQKIIRIPLFNKISNPDTLKQSLFFTAVVTYAKCFNNAEGRGTQLNKKDALSKTNKKLQDFHDEVMELRHKYIAHGGKTEHEKNPITVILNPDLDDKKIINVEDNSSTLVNDDSRLKDYIELFELVKEYVKEKILKLKDLINKEVEQMNIEDLYNNSKKPDLDKTYDMKARSIKVK